MDQEVGKMNQSSCGNQTEADKIDSTMVGVLTLTMPFLPTVMSLFGIICSSGRIYSQYVGQERRWATFLLYFCVPLAFLPFIQIGTNTIFAFLVSYGLIKDLFDVDLIDTDEDLTNEDDEVTSKRDLMQTYMNLGRVAETFGESAPQFILQLVILLIVAEKPIQSWNHLLCDYESSDKFLSTMLVVLSTSYLSLIFSGGSYIVESCFFINGVFFQPIMTMRMVLVNTLAMIFVVTFRCLAIALMIAAYNNFYAIIPIASGCLIYFLGMTILYQMFKKELPELELKDNCGHRRMGLLFMAFSAPVMPCIIMNPKWNILSYASILSAAILIIEMVVLTALTDLNKVFNLDLQILRQSMIDHPDELRLICLGTILGLIVSMSFTAIQVALIRRIHLRKFKYQVLLGDTKTVEERLKSQEPIKCARIFPQACEAQQEDMVKLMLTYGQDKINFNAGERDKNVHKTGYYFACLFGNQRIRQMIEDKAGELDIDLDFDKSERKKLRKSILIQKV